MSVSLRVVMTRPTVATVWPFDIWPTVLESNFTALESAGVESWIQGNEDTDLVVTVDHHFNDNDFYASYKDTALQQIPLWKTASNASEVELYQTDNSITSPITEVADPDHTGWERITLERPSQRSL